MIQALDKNFKNQFRSAQNGQKTDRLATIKNSGRTLTQAETGIINPETSSGLQNLTTREISKAQKLQ